MNKQMRKIKDEINKIIINSGLIYAEVNEVLGDITSDYDRKGKNLLYATNIKEVFEVPYKTDRRIIDAGRHTQREDQ